MTTTIIPAQLVSLETWACAISSSACIGFTSLVPWLFNMTFFEQSKSQKGLQTTNSRMDYLLSFSVGAILGDIFFHLIPESVESHLVELSVTTEIAQRKVGSSILAGIFMFIIVEMILERWSSQEKRHDSILMEKTEPVKQYASDLKLTDLKATSSADEPDEIFENNNNITEHCDECTHQAVKLNAFIPTCGDQKRESANEEQFLKNRKKYIRSLDEVAQQSREGLVEPDNLKKNPTCLISGQGIDPAGYLSLIANGIDNFTHGLAIGASFLVGPKVGLLTTFVIFIHEIPHEICDYAILVNSGFTRWDAVKAQSSVSLFGIMGTATALYFKSIDTLNAKTIWILPFSAGGFLHIALVNLLPEILSRKTNFRDSIEQIGCVIVGIAFMGVVALS